MIGEVQSFMARSARLADAPAPSAGTMIECESGSIEYDESGQGPTVVLVPGSCSTGAAWRPVIAEWGSRFRCVTTSLLGYGRTAERRKAADPDIRHEAEIVESVIRWAGGPVHLVGHSFGGLVGIAVALRNQVPLLSLSVLEAPAPGFLGRMGEEAHLRAIRDMTDAYFGAYEAGKKDAIGTMIDFYGGAGTFASWPQRVRDYAIASTPANIRDWAVGYDFAPEPDALAALDVPTLVLWGEASHPAVRRGNELLSRTVARSRIVTIRGAAHFMIATHPREVASAVAYNVALAEGSRAAGGEGARPA